MALPLLAAGTLVGTIIVPLVVKVLVAFGIGFATYTGVGALLDFALSEIQTTMSALPVQVLTMMSLAGVDKFVTIIFSAYTARLTIAGMTAAGTFTRFNLKGIPGDA